MDQEILKLRKINQNDFQTWKEGFGKILMLMRAI